jgi:hypothetical protein
VQQNDGTTVRGAGFRISDVQEAGFVVSPAVSAASSERRASRAAPADIPAILMKRRRETPTGFSEFMCDPLFLE